MDEYAEKVMEAAKKIPGLSNANAWELCMISNHVKPSTGPKINEELFESISGARRKGKNGMVTSKKHILATTNCNRRETYEPEAKEFEITTHKTYSVVKATSERIID